MTDIAHTRWAIQRTEMMDIAIIRLEILFTVDSLFVRFRNL